MRWACRSDLCETSYAAQGNLSTKLSYDTSYKPYHQCGKCSALNTDYINSVCQTKPILAIKSIRICESNQLSRIVEYFPDLKIIITFRDPRGTYASRKNVFRTTKPWELLQSVI